MFFHKRRERHGWLMGWHFSHRSAIRVEFYWWSARFGLSIGTDDEGWNVSLRLPPLALYVSLEGLGLWQPVARIYTAPDGRQFPIPDQREFDVSVYDWTIRLTLWGRWGEWRARDPWWVRGLSLDLCDLVLGRTVYTAEELALVPCSVPMPEGTYAATAKIERCVWKRPRWFARTEQRVWLTVPKGIPHAGKGENSWDCGDDGLFGIGGASVADAIERAQVAVFRSRRRYGHASEQTVREALL